MVHHDFEGAFAQILLLRELFSIRFTRSEPYRETADRMKSICERIFIIGVPTEDTLLCLTLHNAMSGDLENLQSQITTALSKQTKAAPYTSDDIMSRLELEWQVSTGSLPGLSLTTSSATVPAAKASAKPRKGCSQCGMLNHNAPDCFQPGGAMEGKRGQVLAAKRARRDKVRGKPSIGAKVLHDPTGRAFVLTKTGDALYVDTGSSSTQTPTVEYTGVAAGL